MQSLGRGLRTPSPLHGMSIDRVSVVSVACSGRDVQRQARGDVSRSGNANQARYAMDGGCGLGGTVVSGSRTSGGTVDARGGSDRSMKRSKEYSLRLRSVMGATSMVNGGTDMTVPIHFLVSYSGIISLSRGWEMDSIPD